MEKSRKRRFRIFFSVLVLLSVLMTIFYLPPGMIYYGYDCSFHLMRFGALMDSLREGTFPVYLDYNAVIGYGYATKWFYCDVILIPFAILGNITSLMFAYKVLIITISILCGLFTYMAVNKIYKNDFAASVAALLYTFSLYRIMDLFDRAALGESISFTFIPLVIWGLHEIITGNYKKWYILTIGFSLLIFTHLLSTLMMFGMTLLILIIYYKPLLKQPFRLKYLFLSGIITIFLTVYFWLPMLEQVLSDSFYFMTRRVGSVEDNTLPVDVLLKGLIDGFKIVNLNLFPSVGILLTLGICFRFFVRERTSGLKNADIVLILGLLCFIACLPQFPWGTFPFSKMSILQFPWRLLIFSSYFFAVAGGFYMSQVIKKAKYRRAALLMITVCTVIIIVIKGDSFKSVFTTKEPYTERAYDNLGNIEYFPSLMPGSHIIDERKDTILTIYGDTKVTSFSKDKGITSFDIELKRSEKVELPLLYYKGYKARSGDDLLSVSKSEIGLVEVSVNDSGHITVYYGGTFIQRFSYYLSILSIIIFCIYIFRNRNSINYSQL